MMLSAVTLHQVSLPNSLTTHRIYLADLTQEIQTCQSTLRLLRMKPKTYFALTERTPILIECLKGHAMINGEGVAAGSVHQIPAGGILIDNNNRWHTAELLITQVFDPNPSVVRQQELVRYTREGTRPRNDIWQLSGLPPHLSYYPARLRREYRHQIKDPAAAIHYVAAGSADWEIGAGTPDHRVITVGSGTLLTIPAHLPSEIYVKSEDPLCLTTIVLPQAT